MMWATRVGRLSVAKQDPEIKILSAVDVVMPCFNAAQYVQLALESIFRQTLAVQKVIVVDDGSTDQSAAIVRQFGDKVQLISQANQGISSARNAGLAACTSPMVAFLDADDLWPENSLERRAAYLRDHPQMNGVFAQLQNFISPELDAAEAVRYRVDLESSAARFPGTFLVERAAFQTAGGFDTKLPVGEMIEWLARAAAVGLRFGNIDELALLRRIHGNNTTLKVANAKASYIQAVRAALQQKKAAK
jgi:glycosyltransferase involved in cell wall biosynthesis